MRARGCWRSDCTPSLAMLYQVLAELVVVVHLGFVAFAVGGGLLLYRWRRVLWLHLPAALWGGFIEINGWTCPLTPLENWLRNQTGTVGYEGSFLEHYLLPVLYPTGLTRGEHVLLGVLVLAVNAVLYGWLLGMRRRLRQS